MMSRDSARGRSQNQLRVIPSFLTADDTDRVFRTIRKLAEHDISDWALTGGLAVEMHIQNRGHTPRIRTLNDLDFITREFEGIPTSLAGEFLFRHVHPLDPPGKTILQLIGVTIASRGPMKSQGCEDRDHGMIRMCGDSTLRADGHHHMRTNLTDAPRQIADDGIKILAV